MSGIEEPRSVLPEVATAAVGVGLGLIERRGRAIADYWRALGGVRDPAELMALNLGYCTQLMDDYTAACAEGLKPVSEAPAEPAQANAA
ncbi:hypothetical protein [Phenylobacterium sp.]|jgi:hypothetical protein|uniref:hypothetical protein n=1 Tax=Phenylobacterium sp. TaxID=1871053 RepID=UPI002F9403E0